MYWNLYRKYEVGKDESQRLEHIEDILHRNEEEMSSTDDRFGTYKIILRIERFGNYTKDQEITCCYKGVN
jgi:hypothetical protein